MGLPIFSWFLYNKYIWKNDIYLMCTLFANHYALLTWGPHMVYMGTPYIFDIYMIRCGLLGNVIDLERVAVVATIGNSDHSSLSAVIIIIIIKRGWQCKAGRE